MKYSIASLLGHAVSRRRVWPRLWRSAQPRKCYKVILIGGGAHGLATAFHLARDHGITDVAVLERSWIGGGNTGRNTTIIRSNYLQPACARLYDASLKAWETLSQELNFNLMVSQRGALSLAHSQHDVHEVGRRVESNRAMGIDAQWLSPGEVKAYCPIINTGREARYPIHGAGLQRRAGTVRHDAVAWGYARAADAFGVDIVQNCEVTGFRMQQGAVTGVETSQGSVSADAVGIVAAGQNSVLAAMAGLQLPIETRPLQAFVSEPVKPLLDCVVLSNAVHVYVSQSDKGELVLGAGTDAYNSYAQRGSPHVLERAVAAAIELFPVFSRLRVMRTWAGMVDIAPDASPIIDRTPVRGLYLNGGWGTGGFKATPVSGQVFAHLIARDEPHPLAEPFSLQRFSTGALLDEHGAASVAH